MYDYEIKEMTEIIKEVKSLGFKVYQRKTPDTYFYYTYPVEGEQGDIKEYLGYFQLSLGVWDIRTVHKPCKDCGTGFGDLPNTEGLSLTEQLKQGFMLYPNWYRGPLPIKYKSMDEYKAQSNFNQEYKEV